MSIEAAGSSPLSALAAGLRVQNDASLQRQVLESTDLGDPALSASLQGVEEAGASVARAGVEIAEAKLTGRLLDELG